MLANFNAVLDALLATKPATGADDARPALGRTRRPMRAADGTLLGFDSMSIADAIPGEVRTTRAPRSSALVSFDTPPTER